MELQIVNTPKYERDDKDADLSIKYSIISVLFSTDPKYAAGMKDW